MLGELSKSNREFIREMVEVIAPASSIQVALAEAALARAANFFGDLHSPTGNFWDSRDEAGNLVIGKFTFSTVAGLLPGTTLEQHGALEHHARSILGVLDDQYVVDRLDQVRSGRPINLMGYISGGTSRKGQVSLQIDPGLIYEASTESDRLYEAVSRCAYLLVKSGLDKHKPVAMHAEINNRYGLSQARKEEHDLLKSVGVPEAELPLYRAHVYLTMPQVLALNEDLQTEEFFKNDLAYWSKI